LMLQVSTIVVPQRLVKDSELALRRAGAEGYELFALWSGNAHESQFTVKHLHVPAQRSYRTEDGLCVIVEGDELHRLNVWLFEHQEAVGVQMHAHPAGAYHSETDDEFPIAASLGAYSIVLPEFARHGLIDDRTEVFRLQRTGWVRQTIPISSLITAV
jgi:hypothetical protein